MPIVMIIMVVMVVVILMVKMIIMAVMVIVKMVIIVAMDIMVVMVIRPMVMIIMVGMVFVIVALSNVHQPKTPAYASKQWSKKSSGIYISSNDSAHKQYQKRWHRKYVQGTLRRDSCMKGLGSARRRSWASLPTHL